jgi:Uma2 family endonuclease
MRRLFTVDELHRMRRGVLAADERLELIEGEVVVSNAADCAHAAVVRRLNRLFVARFGERAIVQVAEPLVVATRSELRPDLALLKPRPDFYASRHPRPADVLAVVEVAGETVEEEREAKLPLYARAGIAEVWIADLVEDVVHVFRRPGRRDYGQAVRYGRGKRIVVAGLPGPTFRINEILNS